MNLQVFWTSQTIAFFSALSLVCAFGMLFFRTLLLCIRTYAVQSICLGLAAVFMGISRSIGHLIAIGAVAVAVKGFFIPWFLVRVSEKVGVKRDPDPLVSGLISSLTGAGLAVLAYMVIGRIIENDPIAANGFSLALTLVLLGLWQMAGRKKAITQVLGLLVVENGLFVAALSTLFGMPMIIELGLIFDLLVAVIIMGLLIFRIQDTVQSIDTETLNRLRG